MIQSIGGIIYQIVDLEPRFFILKRKAVSGKIEWVAPKGKMEGNEKPEFTCVREISEETGMDINSLVIKTKLSWWVELKNMNFGRWATDKTISYFLVEYVGNAERIHIQDGEGFTWMYKRAALKDIMNLVPYKDLRAVFREAYEYLSKQNERQKILNQINI